jgi:acetyltransferase-like isoleucine patch superfamily enzyme
MIWRLLGMEVGPGCRVGLGSLVVADHIKLGPGVVIEPFAMIYRPAYLEIGERCRISYFVTVLGSGRLVMRPQAYVIIGAMLDTTHGCYIGDRAGIGARCILMTHGDSQLTYTRGYGFRNGPIEIGADCYLGFGVNVYPKVKIGERSVIAPGVLVTRNIEPDQLVLPPQASSKTRQSISVGLLRARNPHEAQLAKVESDFRSLTELVHGATLDSSREDYWVLSLGRRRKAVLVRKSGAEIAALLDRRTVVWTLARDRAYPVPTFDFSQLTVYGERTALAEQVAAFLCAARAVHFIFDTQTDPASANGRAAA